MINAIESGTGRPVLILHGGGGPFTVAGIAQHLSGFQTILPTHPGWNGTERPDALSTIPDLASLYLAELAERDLTDVLVIGSSLGGWIGTEMALRDTDARVSGLVLVDSVGADIPDHPINEFLPDFDSMPPAQADAIRANMAVMAAYLPDSGMNDPGLLARVADVRIPVLAVWGENDVIVSAAYGERFAAAFPDSRFETVTGAGHLPQLEQPETTFALIDGFVARA